MRSSTASTIGFRSIRWRRGPFALTLALTLASATGWLAFGQAGPVKLVELGSEPLHTASNGQKPTLSLALSVEFPTVGPQYLNDTYSAADEYIGYFDSNSCYAYVNDRDPGLRRFDRIGAATSRGCGGEGFSGNFMNWATSSAIDVLRLGLTGGDRIVDTADVTILQRAVLDRATTKWLTPAAADGALPRALRGTWASRILVSNCLDRVEFGTADVGSCMTPQDNSNLGVNVPDGNRGEAPAHGSAVLTRDRFFYARVRVCESDGGTLADPRATYCARYPNGRFKPVGNLQKYSDRVRVAAFGYLMHNTNERYGGVLRAPMKFVGPKSYDAAGALQPSNPRIEWDEATGVFRANPEDAAEGQSGVVNYLNKFGRLGPNPGTYKSLDPVGELYYEALRYVQGLPPTPEATAGMTTAMKDGFPAYERWDDPHAGGSPARDHSCLRNNILVIGDVNTHNDKSVPGNTTRLASGEFARPANPAGNEPDFVAWTTLVGGFESDTAVPYPGDPTHSSSNPNTATPVARAPMPNLAGMGTANTGSGGSSSYYMAGMAYWANTQDIRGRGWTSEPDKQRPGMRVTTYVLDVNEGNANSSFAQRRTTQFFLAAKYGGFRDRSGVGNPFLDREGRLDNSSWENAAGNGDPRNYYLSSSARAVLDGLDEIFASLASRSNGIASGDETATRLAVGGSAYNYQASFDADGWSGDIQALPVTLEANNSVKAGRTRNDAIWSAADRLNAPTLDPDTRRIVVGRVDATVRTADDFRWANLEDGTAYSLKALLDRPAPNAPPDALGRQRLEFLRGERQQEGTLFRRRTSRLGDFVNSGVAFSGAPSRLFAASSYVPFFERYRSRAPAVFAGSNDGMLHAFDTTTGDELFGYIPSWMGPHLSRLTSPRYNAGLHRGYVDATPRAAEAEFADGSWKTVLVGGTGAGGQGVYALDVSDPAAFDASKVLWEFTDRDDPALGNVLGRPQVLKFRTSARTAPGQPTYRTFVVVAGGVNSAQPDGHASADGAPTLFLLDLSKPAGTSWRLGSNYFRLTAPVDAALSRTTAPGVVDFGFALGPASEVQSLYFGDLHGNLWKLDFSAKGSADWSLPALSSFKRGSIPVPFYAARDAATGSPQPISVPPLLVSAPGQGTFVSFGTGKYLEASDNQVSGTTQRQTLYTLYDNDSTDLDTASGTRAIAGRERLIAGSADGNTGALDLPAFTWGRPRSDGDATQRSGWYLDLPENGERQIGELKNSGETLLFASFLPPAATNDVCGRGSARIYRSSLVTGRGKFTRSTVGALGTLSVVQLGASSRGARDGQGRRTSTTESVIVGQGADGPMVTSLPKKASVDGMLSWRRINNYQDLKNAPSP